MGPEHELEEAVEKAREPFDRTVGATMAIVAAALALVSVLGNVSITEELLLQQKASDQWAYYQSKSIRRYQSESAADVLRALPGPAAAGAAKKYDTNVDRYRQDAEEIQRKAREFEHESEVTGRHALRFHFAEVFLEIAIVFCSLALLTRRRWFWSAGVLLTIVGAGSALTVLLIH
jgi:hypothetical protein